jgi:endo-1,4-beta-xylanase
MLAALVAVGACSGGDSKSPAEPIPVNPLDTMALRTLVASRHLPIGIGSAVGSMFGRSDAVGMQYMNILAREFDVLTPENDMKFSVVQPARGTFVFARADSMVAFAQAHGMRVRGHTLAWYNQLPGWLTNGTWTNAEATALLDDHIQHVVGHYRGQLAAWDVVNEAFNDGQATLRQNFWATHIGRGYIEQAFRTARATDPDVPLFYNDYNIESPGPKADSVYNMLSDFRARGVPVDGIGMQMHLVAGTLPLTGMQQTFARFAALGLKIQITELDIRVPVPSNATSLATQAQNYRDVFQLCLQTAACDMVVMWGFTDASSWVPSTFPGQGDALLFDSSFGKKPAYQAVHDLLAGK